MSRLNTDSSLIITTSLYRNSWLLGVVSGSYGSYYRRFLLQRFIDGYS